MRVFFLFALIACALACAPGEYDNSGVCTGCSTCGTGTYKSGGCSGSTNTLCSVCSTCGAGHYTLITCSAVQNTVCQVCLNCADGYHVAGGCSGSTDTICEASECINNCATCTSNVFSACSECAEGFYLDSLHQICAACATTADCAAIGPYQRLYGICGGPTGDAWTVCLAPGMVLCESCPDVAPGIGITCGSPQYDDSFWGLAPGNRTSCCETELSTSDPISPARNAALYDDFLSCMYE